MAETLRFHPSASAGTAPLHAERLFELPGVERPVDETPRALRAWVQAERAPATGACLVTCADEAEREVADAFDRGFARWLLPDLKPASRAAFRLATLGGRYEWGAVRVAEAHFARAPGARAWKCMVVKVNAHVAVQETADGPRFGRMERYTAEDAACGALEATVAGSELPFARELAEAFALEHAPRLEALRDPERVPPAHRALFAAVASVRLQARRAMLDVQDHRPESPTLWLVLPCVTINRPQHDTELVCGVYVADRRGAEPHDEYCGLGDDPAAYRLRADGPRLAVDDPELERPRRARDHRRVVVHEWRRRDGAPRPAPADAARLSHAVDEARRACRDHPVAAACLGTLVAALVELSPVPAALLLFGEGLVGIHHASRAHRLARETHRHDDARAMLAEARDDLAALPPERAQALVELLAREYA